MLFGRKKLLQEGTEALGVVIARIDSETSQGPGHLCRLRVRVTFDDGATTEFVDGEFVKGQIGPPRVGDVVPVRYDPSDHSRILVDLQKLVDQVAATTARVNAEAIARAEAQLEQSSIPSSWVLGRALVLDVRKETVGERVDCAVTVKVRLVDGTSPYQATFSAKVVQQRADLLAAGRTIVAVRVDPDDHSQVTISWTEDPPVVTVSDPELIEPPARASRDGEPCRIVVLNHARELMKTPDGEELYGSKVRVTSDGSELQIDLLVPDEAVALLQDGKELPAKRLASEPNVVAVDWNAARSEAG
jgi:hypothetical protein